MEPGVRRFHVCHHGVFLFAKLDGWWRCQNPGRRLLMDWHMVCVRLRGADGDFCNGPGRRRQVRLAQVQKVGEQKRIPLALRSRGADHLLHVDACSRCSCHFITKCAARRCAIVDPASCYQPNRSTSSDRDRGREFCRAVRLLTETF